MNKNDEEHSYEGLLLNSASSNKRSLTNQFVDCVKRTKYFVPCALLSPSKTIINQATATTMKEHPTISFNIPQKKPIDQQPKRGKKKKKIFFSLLFP